MPDLAMATEAICRAFNETWADATPIDWPNVARDGPHLREGNEPWVAIHIKHDGQAQHTLGPVGERTFVGEGQLEVQLFVPAGKRGLADADRLAKLAVSAFRGRTVDGVRFLRVGARTIGNDGPWHQTNVGADFEYDEIA